MKSEGRKENDRYASRNFTSRALVHHITLHSVNPSSGHVEEILWLNDHTVLLRVRQRHLFPLVLFSSQILTSTVG